MDTGSPLFAASFQAVEVVFERLLHVGHGVVLRRVDPCAGPYGNAH